MHDIFTIRQATLADMDIIVAHRHKMYEDMGANDAMPIAKDAIRAPSFFMVTSLVIPCEAKLLLALAETRTSG